MNSIDKLTLELLMNRSLWSKNVDQQDIFKTEEQNEMKQKVKKYKLRILQMFTKYLEDPEFHINNEMDEIFEIYSKKSISYFEMNDLAIDRFYSNQDSNTEFGDSDDILFDSVTNASCWSNDRVKKMPAKYTMDNDISSVLATK